MRAYLPLAVAGVVLLTGCSQKQQSGSEGEDTPGTNRPSASASSEAPIFDEEVLPEPTPDDSAEPLTFGSTYTYDDGLSITVQDPVAFTPGESTYTEDENAAAYVYFPVTIVNATDFNFDFDPALGYGSVQSTNVEAASVYDEDILGSVPGTAILPGREAAFKLGFAVADPTDLVLEITPNTLNYESVIFTN